MKAQARGSHNAGDILPRRFTSLANSQKMKAKQTSKAMDAPILMADVPLADRFETESGQQLATMIKQPDKAFHEKIVPHNK